MSDIKLPRLIVFDFHGILSRPQHETKIIQQKLKENKPPGPVNYYNLMITKNADPYDLMPTLDQVVKFIRYIQNVDSRVKFGVASAGEFEPFVIDTLRYCFERVGAVSPFNTQNVVGSFAYAKLNLEAKKNLTAKGLSKSKILYIEYICQQQNIDPLGCEAVLLDDTEEIIKHTKGVCGMWVSPIYFTIDIWNKYAPACGYSLIN